MEPRTPRELPFRAKPSKAPVGGRGGGNSWRGASRDNSSARGRRGASRGPRGNHQPQRDLTPLEKRHLDWKRLIRRDLEASKFFDQTEAIWAGAALLLDDGGQEMQQFVVRDLVDTTLKGCEAIVSTVVTCTEHKNDFEVRRALESFLRVITHPALLESISMSTYVGEIFSLVAGANGSRITALTSSVSRRLQSSLQKDKTVTSDGAVALLALLSKALLECATRERKILLNDEITEAQQCLKDVVDAISAPSATSQVEIIKTRLELIDRMVANANARISKTAAHPSDESAKKGNAVHSTFYPPPAIPGGRHDNDFADISHVQIIPTLQEITSREADYLPSTNLLQPHVINDPVQRHIDSLFRLMRHDIFGPVQDVLGELLAKDDLNNTYNLTTKSPDARAHVYSPAFIPLICVTDRCELEAIVSFSPPTQVRRKSASEQRRWWTESSRLEEGRLVCFVGSTGVEKVLLFLEVVQKSTDGRKDDDKRRSSLVPGSSSRLPSITVKIATCNSGEVTLLARVHGEKTRGVLVDVHGVLPATLVPILKNLQSIAWSGPLPFQQWILPVGDQEAPDEDGVVAIPPPAYARSDNFYFDLSPIKREGITSVCRIRPGGLSTTASWDEAAQSVGDYTTLDPGQSMALVAALSREYALIQGPPGTGKSYLGVQLVRVLLATAARARLGPILIICYTNHALDQFLKHLLDVGIEKIIRVGGRSQAPELETKNLRLISREGSKTRAENRLVAETYENLGNYSRLASTEMKSLHLLRNGPSWSDIGEFLRRSHPSIHKQLAPHDGDGWTTVGKQDVLINWLGAKKISTRTALPEAVVEEVQRRAELSIHALTKDERWALVMKWYAEARQDHSERLFESLEEAEHFQARIGRVYDDIDRRTLAQAEVVGMTTTSLARRIKTLRHVRPKVVICEEAAEVMEPHIISALMPGVEHFIQIGDHRQLRPQISNHALSMESRSGMKWQLDRSQFERRALGEPGLTAAPIVQLNVQRRMRPEVSTLIKNIYPSLVDHESVKSLPDVVGMSQNVFWMDHKQAEDSGDDGSRVKSHSNAWEVDMAMGLVRHLVRQGHYETTDIALLTPYTGQLQQLRQKFSRDYEIVLSDRDMETMAKEGFEHDDGEIDEDRSVSRRAEKKQLSQTLRLATVDNFQGEEAKVIIVSLVRSNEAGKIGFLATENRINVLLSRAQHGLYLIGNATSYRSVGMWAGVLDQLALADAVGDTLRLRCPRHPMMDIQVKEPEDFAKKSPEGGCGLKCDQRLEPCGHQCPARCHSEVLHQAFSCTQPCPRLRESCRHSCPRFCGEICGMCLVPLKDVRLPCGHVKNGVPCHQTLDLSAIKCAEVVQKTSPGCEHVVGVACSLDVSASSFECPKKCGQLLRCGHPCSGTCGTCRKQDEDGNIVFKHVECRKVCDRQLGACHHRCPQLCHDGESCDGCDKQCQVRCPHSRCGLKCSEACAPCIERCTWSCPHQGPCTMPCAAPCNRLPCNERCPNTLPCGHRCPSFCAEDCLGEFCQECGHKAGEVVDMLEFKTYAEIDVDETPVVALRCGHFFTGESLDGMVDMAEDLSRLPIATKIPACPNCKLPIQQFATKRYNRPINRAVMDETTKRFISKGQAELRALEETLSGIEEQLEASRADLAKRGNATNVRYVKASQLERKARALRESMNTEFQPAKRLVDAIATTQRSLGEGTSDDGDLITATTSPAFDKRVTLGAWLVVLRIQEMIHCDRFSVAKSRPSAKVVEAYLAACKKLVAEARAASLPRIAIVATLALANVSHRLQVSSARANANADPSTTTSTASSGPDQREAARQMLEEAIQMCASLPGQQGLDLRQAAEAVKRLFEGPRYEEVTPEELAAIKKAMVSGAGGIASHSGHWYNCVNGHPFAIGECGMPMELARCPECGAQVGGQSHALVEGATRAEEMERD